MDSSGIPPARPARWRTPILAAWAVILMVEYWAPVRSYSEHFWTTGDFQDYWMTSTFVGEHGGRESVYTPAGDRAVVRAVLGREADDSRYVFLHNTQTPFFYALHSPLLTGDFSLDYLLFQSVSTILFLSGLLVLCGALNWGFPSYLALCTAVLLGMTPYQSDLQNGNLNRMLLGLLAVAWSCLRRGGGWRVSGGALLLLAAAVKPTVLLPAGLLLGARTLRRSWKESLPEWAGGIFAAAAVAALVSMRFHGASAWTEWLHRIRSLPIEASPVSSGNFSLAALVNLLTGKDFSGPIFAVGTSLAILLVLAPFSFGPGRGKSGTPEEELLVLGIGSVAVILVSPLAWIHYYVLTLLLFLPLWTNLSPGAGDDSFGRPARRALVATAFFAVCLFVAPGYRVAGDERIMGLYGISVWVSALVTWVLGIRSLWRIARMPEAAGSHGPPGRPRPTA